MKHPQTHTSEQTLIASTERVDKEAGGGTRRKEALRAFAWLRLLHKYSHVGSTQRLRRWQWGGATPLRLMAQLSQMSESESCDHLADKVHSHLSDATTWYARRGV